MVEDLDEIGQDSSSMLAHSQGTFSRAVLFWIQTTAPSIGLSRVPKKHHSMDETVLFVHAGPDFGALDCTYDMYALL